MWTISNFQLVSLNKAKANFGICTVGAGTRIVFSELRGRGYIYQSRTTVKTRTFSWTTASTNVSDSVTFYMAGLEVITVDNLYSGKLVFRKQVESSPILSTSAISNLTQTNANDGRQPVTRRGVCWSTNPGPTTSLNIKISDSTGTGTFRSCNTGLTPFTTLSISGAGIFFWSKGQTRMAITVSPTVATTYPVIGFLGNGCSVTVSIAVNVYQNSPAVPVVSAPSAAFCAKSQTIASSAPSGNQWSLNGLPLSGAASHYCWPLQSGAFSVTVTNPVNGCSSTAQVAVPVTVLPLLQISQQTAAQTVSAGASAQFVLVTEGNANILRWQSGISGQGYGRLIIEP